MSNILIGKRIRDLRESQNYTREEFAEKIYISSKFLYEIEVGKKGFSANTLSKIAMTLNVSSDYILFGKINQYINLEMVSMLNEKEFKKFLYCKKVFKILDELYDGYKDD